MTFVQSNDKEADKQSRIEWRVGEYNRLSKEDGDKPESDSIQNQHSINQNHIEYLRRQGENIVSVKVYSDDGFAGGTFNRPRYQELIRDIEKGKVNCIIFKDNSRLGRNYPELGRLMEDYFPQKGVRVISVLNNLDSVRDPRGYCSAIVSFSNIVNDDYIRQLSIKIKSTLSMKRERGEFTGNYAPFGYRKDPNDHHKLIVNPEEAEIVRMIFDWYEAGYSILGIAQKLNAMQVMTPAQFKMQNGSKGFITHDARNAKTKLWAVNTVKTILRNEVYIGNMVQGKHKSISYRTKRMIPAEPYEWSVVEGTHEAIIADEQFTVVHNRLSNRDRVTSNREKSYLLSGLVVCAHCGHRMNRTVSQSYARYRCSTRAVDASKCQCQSIKESVLESIVLTAVQAQIAEMVDAKKVIDSVRADKVNASTRNEYTQSMARAEREKVRLIEAKFRLYDDYRGGMISKSDYEVFQRKYDDAVTQQDERISKLKECLQQLKESRRRDDEFVDFFKKHNNIGSLDRDTVNQLIERIVYHDPQNIEIYFRFSDEQSMLLDMAKSIKTPPCDESA